MKEKAALAVFGSSLAIFWPGALTFGFPGVMAPVWKEMFHVGRAAAGMTIFFNLNATAEELKKTAAEEIQPKVRIIPVCRI